MTINLTSPQTLPDLHGSRTLTLWRLLRPPDLITLFLLMFATNTDVEIHPVVCVLLTDKRKALKCFSNGIFRNLGWLTTTNQWMTADILISFLLPRWETSLISLISSSWLNSETVWSQQRALELKMLNSLTCSLWDVWLVSCSCHLVVQQSLEADKHSDTTEHGKSSTDEILSGSFWTSHFQQHHCGLSVWQAVSCLYSM